MVLKCVHHYCTVIQGPNYSNEHTISFAEYSFLLLSILTFKFWKEFLFSRFFTVACKNKQSIGFRVMVFNVTFNNISIILWLSVLLVEETGVPGENHRPVASH